MYLSKYNVVLFLFSENAVLCCIIYEMEDSQKIICQLFGYQVFSLKGWAIFKLIYHNCYFMNMISYLQQIIYIQKCDLYFCSPMQLYFILLSAIFMCIWLNFNSGKEKIIIIKKSMVISSLHLLYVIVYINYNIYQTYHSKTTSSEQKLTA